MHSGQFSLRWTLRERIKVQKGKEKVSSCVHVPGKTPHSKIYSLVVQWRQTHSVVALSNLSLFRSVVVGKTSVNEFWQLGRNLAAITAGERSEAKVAHLEFGIETRLEFCPVVLYGTITSSFGFYDFARENGSKLVLQKFPECNSTQHDSKPLLFKPPNDQ